MVLPPPLEVAHCTQLPMSPYSPLVYVSFSVFPYFFKTLTVLRSTHQVFYRLPLYVRLFFSWLDYGYAPQRWRAYQTLHHITGDVKLWSVKIVYVRFLYCTVTVLTFLKRYSLKRFSLPSPPRGGRFKLYLLERWPSIYIIWDSPVQKNCLFSLLLTLSFIYIFLNSCMCTLCFGLDYHPMLAVFIWPLSLFSLGHWELFQVGFWLSHPFYEHFFYFVILSVYFRLILYFSSPALDKAFSLRCPGSFFGFSNKNLGTGHVHSLPLECHCFLALFSQQTRKFMYTNQVYIYLLLILCPSVQLWS